MHRGALATNPHKSKHAYTLKNRDCHFELCVSRHAGPAYSTAPALGVYRFKSILRPWYTGVLLGAERFMASWHKSEEEASKLREVNRAA